MSDLADALDAPALIARHDPSGFHALLRAQAVDLGLWPLYEIREGKLKVTMRPRFSDLRAHLSRQKRFRHLSGEQVAAIAATFRIEKKPFIASPRFSEKNTPSPSHTGGSSNSPRPRRPRMYREGTK